MVTFCMQRTPTVLDGACMHAQSIFHLLHSMHPLASAYHGMHGGTTSCGSWRHYFIWVVEFLSNAPTKWNIRGHPGRPPWRCAFIFLIVWVTGDPPLGGAYADLELGVLKHNLIQAYTIFVVSHMFLTVLRKTMIAQSYMVMART